MIAPPIGYPIAYPKVNPIGFGSPDPDPDTRPRSLGYVCLVVVQDLHLPRHLSKRASLATAGAGR